MRRLLVGVLVLVILGVGLFLYWASRATPFVRDRVVEALNQRFASQVAMESLSVTVAPRPEISGTGLTLRHNGRTDVPPLIAIESFDASAGLMGLLRKPLHLRHVGLVGLQIRIPPDGLQAGNRPGSTEGTGTGVGDSYRDVPTSILIDDISSQSARLEIASGRPGRLPRVFEIHDLMMQGFGGAEGATFQAGVTNPIPRGRVETSGTFGPWITEDPRLTPLRGQYSFKNANLNDIKGIGGILSSVGTYRGILQRIEVEGQTETPDFHIDLAGQPVSLKTRFKAVVDGTNGDTWLDPVEARLADSTIVARGAVVRTEDVKGRKVSLDITIDRARLEDLLRLAVKASKPPMRGLVNVTTKFVLPAGNQDVVDRLQLEGRFTLAQATFTNLDVQRKIIMLSRRGRGEEDDQGAEGESVVSNLRGQFVLRDGRLSFPNLTFAVPGATVELAGVYDLHHESIDFHGDLLTDASLSDMTSGFKSLLARLAQPFFRRPGGGSKLPIRISGPRSKPAFGLDFGRVLGD